MVTLVTGTSSAVPKEASGPAANKRRAGGVSEAAAIGLLKSTLRELTGAEICRVENPVTCGGALSDVRLTVTNSDHVALPPVSTARACHVKLVLVALDLGD